MTDELLKEPMNEIIYTLQQLSLRCKDNEVQHGVELALQKVYEINKKTNKEQKAQDLIRYSNIVEVIDEKDGHGYWRTYYLVDEHGLPCKIVKRNGKVDEIIRFVRKE